MNPTASEQIREHLVEGIARYERRQRRVRGVGLGAVLALVTISGTLALRGDDGRDRIEVGPATTNDPIPGLRSIPPRPGGGPLPGSGIWTGNELLFVGAIDDRGTVVAVGLDPDARTWRTLAPAPIPLGEHTAAVWTGTELIVCCGLDTEGVGYAASYDPVADSWRELPEPPVSGYAWGIWTGDRMYVAAASYGFASFDPRSSQWRSEPSFTFPTYPFTQLVWTGDEVIEWPFEPQRTTWEGESFDPTTGEWSRLPAPPSESWPAIAEVVVVERSIVVLGGLPASSEGSERFVAARFDLVSREWTQLPDPLPEPRSCECNLGSHTALWTGSDLLVHVADLASGASRDGVLLALDPADNTWHTVGDTKRTALTPIGLAGDRVVFEASGAGHFGDYYLSDPGWRPQQ